MSDKAIYVLAGAIVVGSFLVGGIVDIVPGGKGIVFRYNKITNSMMLCVLEECTKVKTGKHG